MICKKALFLLAYRHGNLYSFELACLLNYNHLDHEFNIKKVDIFKEKQQISWIGGFLQKFSFSKFAAELCK